MLPFINIDHVFRAAPVLCGLVVLVSALLPTQLRAETGGWSAPALVPDNPVLRIFESRWIDDDGKGVVAGYYMSFDDRAYMQDGLHPGTNEFWEGILAEDTNQLIYTAEPVDNVGLSYFLPFVVAFPTQSLRDIWMEDERHAGLDDLFVPTTKVLLHIHRHTNGFDLDTVYLFFVLDEASEEEPGRCHARQVVRVLYTGEPDQVELLDCLDAEKQQ